MPWHSIGEHKKVFEYDGAFECKNCKASWGALTGAKPEPPEKCQTEHDDSKSASVPGLCPHCGYNVFSDCDPFGGCQEKGWFIICPDCIACGPIAETKMETELLFRKRA